MKNLFVILALLLAGTSFGQKRVPGKAIPVKIDKMPNRINPEESIVQTIIFGQYKISKYTKLAEKCPSSKDLSLLIGTLVKIQETALTGDEIDPLTFEIYEIEKMASADYIYREFGAALKSTTSDLPPQITVHKTSAEGCYGIVEINRNQLAIPYKGTLLFLERL